MAIRIALAGNPNCGKTTMFNALTGANQYVGNWPGNTENFVQTSRALCEKLYGIMNSNIDIPAADVAVVVFFCGGRRLFRIFEIKL